MPTYNEHNLPDAAVADLRRYMDECDRQTEIEDEAYEIAEREALSWLGLVRDDPNSLDDLADRLLYALSNDRFGSRWRVLRLLGEFAAKYGTKEGTAISGRLAGAVFELLLESELPEARREAEELLRHGPGDTTW